jgi:hypothetical protein
MIKHVLYLDEDDCECITKSIDVPFPLIGGMGLIVGESAAWNNFHVYSVTWQTEHSEMICWLRFLHLAGMTNAEAGQRLLSEGWRPD